MRGSVALKSTVDPQAATITFNRGEISVVHGVRPDADMVISADLNTMGRPGSPKPKVTGAMRHLGFAMGVSKVLEPPVVGGWQGAVDEFWEWAADKAGRPDLLRVVCTDDDSERVVGSPGGSTIEIHGPAWVLEAVFTGGDHLGAAMIEQRLQMVAPFPVFSPFIGLATRRMLGEQ